MEESTLTSVQNLAADQQDRDSPVFLRRRSSRSIGIYSYVLLLSLSLSLSLFLCPPFVLPFPVHVINRVDEPRTYNVVNSPYIFVVLLLLLLLRLVCNVLALDCFPSFGPCFHQNYNLNHCRFDHAAGESTIAVSQAILSPPALTSIN